MRFYDDVAAERPRIEEAIRKYGYAPEHHFEWYQFGCEEGDRNIFAEADQGALLTTQDANKKMYYVFSSPIASPDRRASLLVEYIALMLSDTATEKIWLELETPLRQELLRTLPSAFKANPINYTLVWPVTDLRSFDPALPGGHYKTLRKEKHKFYREHKVVVCDARTYEDRAGLHAIVDNWKARRGRNDRAYLMEYHNSIDGNFAGMDEARVFVVDGKAAGFNTGWRIPNSNRYYGAIGVHDYSVEDLGDMLYLEDLEWLKQRGYGEVDMAGGEGALTAFKNKFRPTFWYKTHVFSIVKK